MALTDKQVKFIDEYMIDMNATAAYLRAGYDCSEEAARRAGSRLLTNVDIRTELDKRQKVMQEKTGISVEWVLERLTTLADRCMQAEAVTDREGNQTGEWKFDSSGANKALESIGKHLGMFKDKVEHSGDMTFVINRKKVMADASGED